MISFKTYLFLIENRAEKTLNWLKNDYMKTFSHQPEADHDATIMSDHLRGRDHSFPPLKVGKATEQVHDYVHHVVDHIAKLDPHPEKVHTQWLLHGWRQGDYKHHETIVSRVEQEWKQHFEPHGISMSDSKGKMGTKIEKLFKK